MYDNYEQIQKRILENMNLPIDKREGSFLNNMISPVSLELANAYLQMKDILSLAFIETNFNQYLDRRINEFGLFRKEDETDEEFRERFEIHIKNDKTSGNKHHFKFWALEVYGVYFAKVFPLWNGNGTVKVTISDEDNMPVSGEILTNCYNHISDVMPIGCDLTVSNIIPIDINIKATIKLNFLSIKHITIKFEEKLKEYLRSDIKTIYYSKLFGLLADIDEVEFVDNFLVNDSLLNIQVNEESVGRVNLIELDEVL